MSFHFVGVENLGNVFQSDQRLSIRHGLIVSL
jgi:hypothetical protein